MKKVLLSAVAIFAFGFANAQETKFGVKAGINFSNFGGDIENTDGKIGALVGGFAEIKLSDKFAVQPELMFSMMGAKSDDVTLNLNYIAIPVMAKFFATEQFSIEAGPQVGFLMSAKAKADGETEDIKDSFNSTDFGMNLGLGYDFTENIGVGLRYNLGLSNILKDSGDFKGSNNAFSLAVAYKF